MMRLPVASLRFTLESQGLFFPTFPGTVWHGGLGKMLARDHPTVFRLLYATAGDAQLYALRPDPMQHRAAGERFTLGLTLFGPAVETVVAVTHAIARLGEEGMDPAGRYRLVSAAISHPTGEQTYFTREDGLGSLPRPAVLGDCLAGMGEPCTGVAIELVTPLRLKSDNALVRELPCYATLLARLIARIGAIAKRCGVEDVLEAERRRLVFAEAHAVAQADARLAWEGLTRRSARTRQQMRFGGLIGWLGYFGHIEHTLPWLEAAEHVQLGGKTAFGFGVISVHPFRTGEGGDPAAT